MWVVLPTSDNSCWTRGGGWRHILIFFLFCVGGFHFVLKVVCARIFHVMSVGRNNRKTSWCVIIQNYSRGFLSFECLARTVLIPLSHYLSFMSVFLALTHTQIISCIPSPYYCIKQYFQSSLAYTWIFSVHFF